MATLTPSPSPSPKKGTHSRENSQVENRAALDRANSHRRNSIIKRTLSSRMSSELIARRSQPGSMEDFSLDKPFNEPLRLMESNTGEDYVPESTGQGGNSIIFTLANADQVNPGETVSDRDSTGAAFALLPAESRSHHQDQKEGTETDTLVDSHHGSFGFAAEKDPEDGKTEREFGESVVAERGKGDAYPQEEDSWEDLPSVPRPWDHRSSSVNTNGRSTSPVKRRTNGHSKTVYVAASPQKKRFALSPSKPKPKHANQTHGDGNTKNSKEEVVDVIANGSRSAFSYSTDVLRTTLRLLKLPLGFMLFLYLLSFILGNVSDKIRDTFSPLCVLPVLSYSGFCAFHPAQSRDRASTPRWADFPKLADIQSQTFESLLVETVGSNSVSLDIKRVEMATSDLSAVVRASDLKSRERLADLLDQFVGDAKTTGRRLQRMSAKVGGAVNQVLTINDHALRTIEAAAANTPEWYSPRALVSWGAQREWEKVAIESFVAAMDTSTVELRKLIVEAEASLSDLYGLEESLESIHAVTTAENRDITVERGEVLQLLWTRLGGNKGTLSRFDENLDLLKNVGAYREKARVHVVAALHTLTEMSDDMDELRERASAPQLGDGKIPLEVHVRSIRGSLEKLNEGRLRAKRRGEEAIQKVIDSA